MHASALLLLAAVGALGMPEDLLNSMNPLYIGPSDVKLYLYTQKNRDRREVITPGDASSSPSFNASHPTRVIAHGWTANAGHMDAFARTYLATGRNYNVVLVDYSSPASGPYYIAVPKSRLVGEYLAAAIRDLAQHRGLRLHDVYLIGHSLGAHVVGTAGNRLQGQVAHVVGLDPAGPSFELMPLENRLDASDGKLVQAIHTNAGGLGFPYPLGDIDFYPNGGSKQPSCPPFQDMFGQCSHIRAINYYLESITSNRSVGTWCSNYASFVGGICNGNPRDILGEYASGRVKGSYYLKMNAQPPYGQSVVDPTS